MPLFINYILGKSLHECLCLYFRLKQLVFQGSKPYQSEVLENMLQETLGANTYMSDIKHPKYVIFVNIFCSYLIFLLMATVANLFLE